MAWYSININGSNTTQRTTTFTGSYVTCSVALPASADVRTAHNGTKPVQIKSVSVPQNGKGATRTSQYIIGSATSSTFSVASAGSLTSTDNVQNISAYTPNRNSVSSFTLKVDFSGETYFANRDLSGYFIDDGAGGWSGRSLTGYYKYILVPLAPTWPVSFASSTAHSVTFDWNDNSDWGGTVGASNCSYLVQISTSSTFATVLDSQTTPHGTTTATFDTNINVNTTYYARVLAKNEIYTASSAGSPWSATKSVATTLALPNWDAGADTTIGTTMFLDTEYTDFVQANSDDPESTIYSIVGGTRVAIPGTLSYGYEVVPGVYLYEETGGVGGTPTVANSSPVSITVRVANATGTALSDITISDIIVLPGGGSWQKEFSDTIVAPYGYSYNDDAYCTIDNYGDRIQGYDNYDYNNGISYPLATFTYNHPSFGLTSIDMYNTSELSTYLGLSLYPTTSYVGGVTYNSLRLYKSGPGTVPYSGTLNLRIYAYGLYHDYPYYEFGQVLFEKTYTIKPSGKIYYGPTYSGPTNFIKRYTSSGWVNVETAQRYNGTADGWVSLSFPGLT